MKKKRLKKQCFKVRYPSAEAARKALRQLKHTGVRTFYKCPHCRHYWHLTSE